jgi:hypothetical protein
MVRSTSDSECVSKDEVGPRSFETHCYAMLLRMRVESGVRLNFQTANAPPPVFFAAPGTP